MAGGKRKKCKPCECKKGLPLWIGTFGDLMSLLLVFFVLLLSMAHFDTKKLKEAQASIDGTLSILSGGTKIEPSMERMQKAADMVSDPETTDEVKKLKSIVIEYNEMTKVSKGPSSVLDDGDEGFLIRLPANTLFKEGSAEIYSEDSVLFIKRMAQIVKMLPKGVIVSVRGHTDNIPLLLNSEYRNNWELSAFRAMSVSKILVEAGISPQRISTCGNSSYKPIASNTTEEGRAKNRRVDIYFHSQKNIKEAIKKSVLD